MRYVRIGPRVVAMVLVVAAMTAGCTGGVSPTSGPASAEPAAGAMFPAVFAASFPFTSANPQRGDLGERIALLSSRTGDLVRWLTPRQDGEFDAVLSVQDGWVYFLRGVASVSVWRVPVAGGRAQLVQAGAVDYAVSPDGRAVAYAPRGPGPNWRVSEIVVRNLVTGRQNTIVMATNPDLKYTNGPPGISGLTWAPDDTHLAVTSSLSAVITSVQVFDAFTARTGLAGRTASAPCPGTGYPTCGDLDPAYLTSGALTYVIQRVSGGTVRSSLIEWRAGRLETLLSFPAGAFMISVSAQGQAIWVTGPPEPKGAWTIWRWSGGAPVKITTLPTMGQSPDYGVGGVAW
jgi:hypothetical protein